MIQPDDMQTPNEARIAKLESDNDLLRKEVEAIRDAIWGINYGSEDFHKNMRKADEFRDMRLRSKGESK